MSKHFLFFLALLWSSVTPAQVPSYQLEHVTIHGSDRVSEEYLLDNLNIKKGQTLDDAFLTDTQAKILGLGCFRSATLHMEKGSSPGKVNLRIDLEDDEEVLTSAAIGSEVGYTQFQLAEPFSKGGSKTMHSIRASVISRNLFRALLRGSFFVDMDDEGIIRQAQIAAGYPRLSFEGTQLDAELSFVDVEKRYFDAKGFGSRAQGLLSSDSSYGTFVYGAAMYTNKSSNQGRFAVPHAPPAAAGPKIGLYRSTRLLGFVPSAGYSVGASSLLSLNKNIVVEANVGQTIDLFSALFFSTDLEVLGATGAGGSVRADMRLDMPIIRQVGASEERSTELDFYLRGRFGFDEYLQHQLFGRGLGVGARFHVQGLIGDVGIFYLSTPKILEESGGPP